jgi:hypothetical protein
MRETGVLSEWASASDKGQSRQETVWKIDYYNTWGRESGGYFGLLKLQGELVL